MTFPKWFYTYRFQICVQYWHAFFGTLCRNLVHFSESKRRRKYISVYFYILFVKIWKPHAHGVRIVIDMLVFDIPKFCVVFKIILAQWNVSIVSAAWWVTTTWTNPRNYCQHWETLTIIPLESFQYPLPMSVTSWKGQY